MEPCLSLEAVHVYIPSSDLCTLKKFMVPPIVVKWEAVLTGEDLIQLMRTGPSPSALQVTDASWYSSMCEFSGGGENFNFSEIGKKNQIFYLGLTSAWLEFISITLNTTVMNLICIKKKWSELSWIQVFSYHEKIIEASMKLFKIHQSTPLKSSWVSRCKGLHSALHCSMNSVWSFKAPK